jgi:phosphotransferase system HPr-like phosphotransfer protein
MVVKKLVVKIPRGLRSALHAAIFVQKIYSSESEVTIIKNHRIVSGGIHIMRSSQFAVKVLGLAINAGDEITIMVSGLDEQPTLIELEKVLLNKDPSLLPYVEEQNHLIDV